jgi:hypothetical protein
MKDFPCKMPSRAARQIHSQSRVLHSPREDCKRFLAESSASDEQKLLALIAPCSSARAPIERRIEPPMRG